MRARLGLILCCLATVLPAKPVEILAFAYPPLQGKTAISEEGVAPEIVRAAFAASGVETTLTMLPTGRAISRIRTGESLVMIGLMDYFSPETKRHLSGFPLMVVDFYVFYTKDRFPGGFRFTDVEDLRPYSVGVRLNGTTDLYARSRGLWVETAPTLDLVFLKLDSGRSDVCISNDLAAFYLIEKLFPSEQDRFRYCAELPFLSQISTAIFNRKHPDCTIMEEKFHTGLRTIMGNGTWQRIISRYYPNGRIPESSLKMVRDFLATEQ